MKVQELMVRDVKSCFADESLNHAARIMWEGDCGVVPIVDGSDRVVGMITDRDVCMAAYTQGRTLDELRIWDAMAREVLSCASDDSLESAMSAMKRAHVRRLPVVDTAGKLVGVLSLNDLACEADREAKAGRPAMLTDVAQTMCAIGQHSAAEATVPTTTTAKPAARSASRRSTIGA